MVIYLDLAFLLNALADAGALYLTGRLTGRRPTWGRLALAAALGGLYGTGCVVPSLDWLALAPVRLFAAAGLVTLVYGREKRLVVVFYMVSCALGGVVTAVWEGLNWGVFLSAGGGCFLVLSVVFRGDGKQAAAGRLLPGWVCRRGEKAPITALFDTGHTLTHGEHPVLTVHWGSVPKLWTKEETAVLRQLERRGPVWCLERLGPGFHLLPYTAVGVPSGLLLCCAGEKVRIGDRELKHVTLALAPGPLGPGWDALWGGMMEEKENMDAA